MFVGTVVGNVVAPVQHPFYDGRTLLLVQIERPSDFQRMSPGCVLAVDRVGAGIGEKVLILKEGSSARTLFDEPDAPVRTVIVGILDEVECEGRVTFRQGDLAR